MEDIISQIDFTKELPGGVEGLLIAGGIVLISTLFIILFLNIKKNKGKVAPIFMGVAGYIIFPILGYNIVASLIMALPGVRDMYNDGVATVSVVLSIVTAVMFTLARLVVVKVMKINDYTGKGNFYNAGIGISLGNIVIFGMSLVSLVVWCNAINQEGLQGIFGSLPAEEVTSTWNSIEPLFTYHVAAWFVMALSYAIDILLYASLTWLDGCVAVGKLPKIWHLFGGLMNFAVILPFDLYDGTKIAGFVVPFVIKFIFMAVVVFIIAKYTGRIDDEEVMKKNIKKMPKIGNLSKL